jgi:sialic acid synthase SpsE
MSSNMSANLFDVLQSDPRRTFFVADAGLNHGGSKEKALAMIRAAKWAGADAVRFDTFKADSLNAAQRAEIVRPTALNDSGSLKKFELGFDVLRTLYRESDRLELELLSTAFDEESTDFLEEMGVRAFNIARADIANVPLLKTVAKKHKPILLSTALMTVEEIENTIDWIFTQANHQVILMHSVSACPSKPEEMSLKSIEYLRERFGLPVGLSDYGQGELAATVAVSLGAQVIERHFMLDTRGDVPHRDVSFDTKQLRAHFEGLGGIGRMLGEQERFPSTVERQNSNVVGRPLYAKRPAARGETISSDLLATLQ